MKIVQYMRRGEMYAVLLGVCSLIAFGSVSIFGDSQKLVASLDRLNGQLVLGILALVLVGFFMHAIKFQMFANHLNIKVPFGWMVIYYIAGFAMSATPGKIGELLRLWLIRRRHGYSIERTLPMQIADRASDAVASVVLCLAALGTFPNYRTAVISATVVVVAGMVLLMRPKLLFWFLYSIYRLFGRQGRLLARLRRLVRGTAKLFVPRIFLPALVLAIIAWGCECITLYLCMITIGGIDSLGSATFIYTFSSLAGVLSLLPGGVGTTEVSMVGLLVVVGVKFEDAVTTTAIVRIATLWFGILIGIAVLTLAVRPFPRGSTGHPSISDLDVDL